MNTTVPNARYVERQEILAALALPHERPAEVDERSWSILLQRREGRTMQEIATALHLSRERVGQIEKRTLAKIGQNNA